MNAPRRGREIHLIARPRGLPCASDFALREVDLPPPGEGQIVVRNHTMSVDPYMRGRLNDVRSYAPPFALGAALSGAAVGVVLASRAASVAQGAWVLHGLGWREYAVLDAAHCRVIDPKVAPPEAYLGVLGMPGLTAYVGLLEVAAMRPGEVVFVSAAAGAVGSLVGQIARLRGASRVIGSAGSAAKIAYVREELGFDAAFDYHSESPRESLREAAPEGIDVYFDNTGGAQLEAALAALRLHGRVALCGAIAQYNDLEPPPGPRNLALAIGKRLTLRGFLVNDFADRRAEFEREMAGWIQNGAVRYRETVLDGLTRAPEALIGLFRGDNVGKMLVRLHV